MDARRLVERIWYDDDAFALLARGALVPFAFAYRGLMQARAQLYEYNALRVEAPAIPTVSVGNLTVGGTGKTPVTAWIATHLSKTARPAIVLRGYGDDEIDVHRRLNPSAIVIASPDRVAAIAAAERQGADVAILDDAFQHRRVARTADVLLLSVEQTIGGRRLIPAGPWREPLGSARRADLIVLTRKSATTDVAAIAEGLVREFVHDVPIARIHLAPKALVDANSAEAQPLELFGKRVVAIAAIAEPDLFRRQLEQLGADVTLMAFPDHHAFLDDEVAALAARIPRGTLAVCTLKDAVKLAARWPGPSRLWYVSQQLSVEQGQKDIDRLLRRVLAARDSRASTSSAG